MIVDTAIIYFFDQSKSTKTPNNKTSVAFSLDLAKNSAKGWSLHWLIN